MSEPRGPAVDAAHIYWGDIGPAPTTIGRANLDGTGVKDSFIEFPLGDAVGEATIPSLSRSTVTTSTGRTSAPWMERSGAPASTAWAVGRRFLTGIGTPVAVAVDDAHIYWPNGETAAHVGSIGRANLDGTGVDQSFLPDPTVTLASAVAVDSSNDFSFGEVEEHAHGNGEARVQIAGSPWRSRTREDEEGEGRRRCRRGCGRCQNKLVIKPKGKARKKLNEKGKAKVNAEVTYIPTEAASKPSGVTLEGM